MMEYFLQYAALVFITYLFASIPWGFIIGKINHVDIRKCGSGNIGATNVTRVMGKTWGRICFFCDFLKGLIPVLAVILLKKYNVLQDAAGWAEVLAAFSSICGHIWSIYLGFKGGKGVAVSAGALIALAPVAALIAGLVWIAAFSIFRYVSLASIIAALSLPLAAFGLSVAGLFPINSQITGLLCVVSLIAVLKHISNIKRLLQGTESKFEKKTAKSEN